MDNHPWLKLENDRYTVNAGRLLESVAGDLSSVSVSVVDQMTLSLDRKLEELLEREQDPEMIESIAPGLALRVLAEAKVQT